MASHSTQFAEGYKFAGKNRERILGIVFKALASWSHREYVHHGIDVWLARHDDIEAVVFEGTTFKLLADVLWIYSTESDGNVESVIEVIGALQSALDDNKPFYVAWAHTCSRNIVGEFGGGASCIYKGSWLCGGDAKFELMRKFEKNELELSKRDEYVWCDQHGSIHERTDNPFEDVKPTCSPEDWDDVYIGKKSERSDI